MRHRGIVLVSILVSWACSSGTENGNDAGNDATPQGEAGADSPSGLTVNGHVKFDDGSGPAAGAQVQLVDAKSHVLKATSGNAGEFSFAGVTAPYAVTVDGPNPNGAHAIYENVSAASIVLATNTAPTGWAQHDVKVTFHTTVPNCGTSYCSLNVAAYAVRTSTDSIASGGYTTSYPSAPGIQAFDGDVTWSGLSSSRSIVVNTLVFDSNRANFWLATSSFTAADGQTPLVNTTPTTIGTAETASVNITEVNVPSSLTFSASAFLSFPNGGGDTEIFQGSSPIYSFGLPSITGATFEVAGYASDNVNHMATSAIYSKAFSLTTPTVSLTLTGPPSPVAPTQGSSIKATDSITWADPGGAALYSVELERKTDGGSQYLGQIFTDKLSVSLPAAAALGFDLSPGAFTAQINAYRPAQTIDAFLSAPPTPYPTGDGFAYQLVNFNIAP